MEVRARAAAGAAHASQALTRDDALLEVDRDRPVDEVGEHDDVAARVAEMDLVALGGLLGAASRQTDDDAVARRHDVGGQGVGHEIEGVAPAGARVVAGVERGAHGAAAGQGRRQVHCRFGIATDVDLPLHDAGPRVFDDDHEAQRIGHI